MLLRNYRKESVKNMSDKIKNQLEKYEIKTSSKQILNRFYEIRDTKTSKKQNGFFWIKLTSKILVAASLLFAFVKLVFPTGGTKGNNPSSSNSLLNGATLIEDDNENHVAFQLLSGIGLLDFIDSDSAHNLAIRRRQNISLEQFSEIVNVFDKANELINNSSFMDIEKTVYEGDFVVSNKHYPFMMNIKGFNEDIVIYYDSKIENDEKHETETEIHGEVHYQNKTFKILGEKEEEQLDSEFELTIFIDEKNYIKIEQEIEVDEYEYKYFIHEDGAKVYEIDYSEEIEGTTLEIKDNVKNYYFIINKNDGNLLIEYAFLDFKGTMTLVYDGNIRIYFEDSISEKIVKE